MTVGGRANQVFCFVGPCECHLYAAPRNIFAGQCRIETRLGIFTDLLLLPNQRLRFR
jgi:hypothetical protein